MKFPLIAPVSYLTADKSRLFIGAYGFEDRTLGWLDIQAKQENILAKAFMVNYLPVKGDNKIVEIRNALEKLGIDFPTDWEFDFTDSFNIENKLAKKLGDYNKYDEIVLDVSSLTKFLILIFLSVLANYKGALRIVYSESLHYPPSKSQYEREKNNPQLIEHFPTQGFGTILRAKSLSSIRMQGQPVCLVAFTSFNEQLVRYMLGTINPYRLILLNGKPPRDGFDWRERATYVIHSKLFDEYKDDNPIDTKTKLPFAVSTLHYLETVEVIDNIHKRYAKYEKIIIAATGSKMQTVGLFFNKIKYPDIHIEYPTPDSYLFTGKPTGVKCSYEIHIPNYSDFLSRLYITSKA